MQVPFSPYGFLILSGKKSNTSGEGQLAQLSLLPVTAFMYDLLKPLGVQLPSIGEDLPSTSVCPSFQAMNFFWDKDLLSPLSLSTTSKHLTPRNLLHRQTCTSERTVLRQQTLSGWPQHTPATGTRKCGFSPFEQHKELHPGFPRH